MPSRADRRRQERQARKQRTVELPEGMLLRADVLTPQGVEEVTNWRTLPAKRPGVHRWACFLSHYMTPEQAEAFVNRTESSPVRLDASSIMYAGVGCVDCERAYQEAVGSPCPAGDEWPES